jgi:hypothetical protein
MIHGVKEEGHVSNRFRKRVLCFGACPQGNQLFPEQQAMLPFFDDNEIGKESLRIKVESWPKDFNPFSYSSR